MGNNYYKAAFCLFISMLVLVGCKIELYSNLDENDTNDMLAILIQNGIDSNKIPNGKKGTFAIHVDQREIPVAVELLKQHGFPREKFVSVAELFKKEGLISSPLEERVRFIYALSQDVQETLSRIDGVVTARVHIVLPENDPFVEDVKPSSASVFIKYIPGTNLNDIKSDIKLIVEKSIQGLHYDKVSVVMLPSQRSSVETVQQWERSWGVRLPVESVTIFHRLVWVLASLLLLLSVSSVYLIALLWRRQAAQDGRENTSGRQSNQTIVSQLLRLIRWDSYAL